MIFNIKIYPHNKLYHVHLYVCLGGGEVVTGSRSRGSLAGTGGLTPATPGLQSAIVVGQ